MPRIITEFIVAVLLPVVTAHCVLHRHQEAAACPSAAVSSEQMAAVLIGHVLAAIHSTWNSSTLTCTYFARCKCMRNAECRVRRTSAVLIETRYEQGTVCVIL
jgi:hypothetical protein